MASRGDARSLAARVVRDNLALRPDEAIAVCAQADAIAAAAAPEDSTASTFVADAVNGFVGARMAAADAVPRMERALAAHRDDTELRADAALSSLAALVALGLVRPQDVRRALRDQHLLLDALGDKVVADDLPEELSELLPQLAWLVGLADAWVGDLPRGVVGLRRAVELAGDAQPVITALALMLLGKALSLRGEVVEARRHLVAARELAASSDGIELGNGHLECSAYLPLVVGDDEGFLAVLELLASEGRGGVSGLGPEYRLELATALAAHGDRRRAVALASGLRGDTYAGRPVSPLMRAWADWVVDPGSEVATRVLTRLAARPDPSENIPGARVTWLLGSDAARTGRRGEAIRLLESAAERCTAMGALGYVRRIESEISALVLPEGATRHTTLRVAGHTNGARNGFSSGSGNGNGSGSRTGNGHAKPILDTSSLTPAERRVAHAVCGGLSNREVAELLVLSERTVETHLTSIFRKLGIRNRTELAVSL